LVRRATRPSSPSKNIATKIASDAASNCPFMLATIA